LEKIAGRDVGSLGALYDATSRWVYGLAFRILGDAHLAEEVSLEVYMQVWRQAASYAPRRGTPASWLTTIARSRALDRLRSRAGRRSRERALEEALDAAAPGGSDPFLYSAERERSRLVRNALSALPPEQRRAIELAYFAGLTHAEIAKRSGEPLGTVKTRIRLGMMKLRGLLGPLEGEA
jgi:RNA polymerase sigma-70 factor (ECF subfamily)